MEALKYQHEISIPQAKAFLPQGTSWNDEIFLIENLTAQDLPATPKDVKCFVIILCTEGKLRYEIDGHTVFAGKNDLILLSQGQQTDNYRTLSPTFNGKAILIKPEHLFSLVQDLNCIISLKRKLVNIDYVKLNVKEMQLSCSCYSQIASFLTDTEYTDNLKTAISWTTSILQMALSKKRQLSESTRETSPDQEIYYHFIRLVDEYVMQQLPVSGYCDKLQISVSALESIISKYGGCTPLKYIHLRLLNRICIMAECTSKKKMSIKKIAEYTHFKNGSALSRFVKEQLNMTLTNYRNLKSEMQQNIIHRTILDQSAVLEALPKTYIQEGSIPPPF